MHDLTQGPVGRTIVTMAAPVAAGMLFQTLYLLVDLYFVAALGEAAVAGVGAAGTLMFMVMAVTQILGVSAIALISQAVGKRDPADANLIFNQSLALAAILGSITLLCGYLFADLFMAGISADGAAQAQGTIFLYWFVPGMAMQFGIMGMSSALRATGIVKPAMVVQMLTVLLNILLAPVLIAGWGPGPALGVLGAGLASSLSVSVGMALLVLYFVKKEKYVSFQRHLWRPDLAIWQRMFAIGLPAGGEMLLMFVYFAVVYWVIQPFGASAQAGFSVGGRIMQSIFMPTMAIAFAIAPIVGQNFGAGQQQRVREAFAKGTLMNAGVMLVVTLFMQIQPVVLVGVFTDDAEVIAAGGDFLRLVSLNFVAQGVVFTCSGLFQGLGNTRPALVSSAFRLLLFVPLVLLAAAREEFSLRHVWYISIVSVWAQACFSYWLVQRELRLKLTG